MSSALHSDSRIPNTHGPHMRSALGKGARPAVSNDGYILYLVLFLLTICGVLATVALATVKSVTLDVIRRQQRLQARLLAESGIERAEFFLNGGDGHDLSWETPGLDEDMEPYGSIHLESSRFGGYARVKSVGTCRRSEHALRVLLGRDIPPELGPTVTLTGRIGGLIIDRNSALTGTVVLHHGDVRAGDVNSRSRTHIRGAEAWMRHEESPPLPFDIGPLDTVMAGYAAMLTRAPDDTSARMGPVTMGETASDSDTVVVIGDLTVTGTLRNASAVVTGTLAMASGAECRGCFFVAQDLRVEGGDTYGCLFFTPGKQVVEGGVHASQLLCEDSIVIAREVTFISPTFMVSHRLLVSDTALSGGIVTGDGCWIEGHLLCYTDSADAAVVPSPGPAIALGKGCHVSGSVLTDGDVRMKDVTIDGHLWCHLILAEHDQKPWKNWLLGCTLGPLRRNVPFPLLGETPAKVGIVGVKQ